MTRTQPAVPPEGGGGMLSIEGASMHCANGPSPLPLEPFRAAIATQRRCCHSPEWLQGQGGGAVTQHIEAPAILSPREVDTASASTSGRTVTFGFSLEVTVLVALLLTSRGAGSQQCPLQTGVRPEGSYVFITWQKSRGQSSWRQGPCRLHPSYGSVNGGWEELLTWPIAVPEVLTAPP